MKTPNVNIPGIAAIVAILTVWELLDRAGAIDYTNIPSPTEIATALKDLVSSGDMTAPFLHTLWIMVLGSGLALVIGTAFGAALGLSTHVFTWSMASVDFLRTVPVVALLPVVVLLWGPSTQSELVVTVYVASWIMMVNTAGGFRSVHPRLGEVAATLRLSRTATIGKVWLPAIMPSMLVGARLAVVSAGLNAIVAETFVNPAGLGWELMRAAQGMRPADLWAYAFVAGLFGYLLNLTILAAVRSLSPGGRDNPALIGA